VKPRRAPLRVQHREPVRLFHHCRPVVVRMFPNMKFDATRVAELADHISRFSLLAIQGLGPE